MKKGGSVSWDLIQGDCLVELRKLEENSVDALVTDPPAGISFMGKSWDSDHGGRAEWIARMKLSFAECLRVLKPGAHGLVWALPRTSHWTATALEDAGFEVRDVILHLFGQGFPKSLDISKAIDKANGDKRPVVATVSKTQSYGRDTATGLGGDVDRNGVMQITSAAWQGWGTALKPASEHWILVRKPLSEKNVSANVLKWGTGGINVDGCRVESGADYHELKVTQGGADCGTPLAPSREVPRAFQPASGRFPANLVLSHSPYCEDDQCDIECAIAMLDAQSGTLKSGASRFFYCAKISSSERNAGLYSAPDKVLAFSGGAAAAAAAARGEEYDNGDGGMNRTRVVKNNHPTVKPLKLMRYFCRMVTPPNGLIIDPFAGSGSTGVAALQEGFRFVGIEREPEYAAIAKMRLISAAPLTNPTERA